MQNKMSSAEGIGPSTHLRILSVSGSLDRNKGGGTKAVIELNEFLCRFYFVKLLVVGNAPTSLLQVSRFAALFSNRFGFTLQLLRFRKLLREQFKVILLHGHFMFTTLVVLAFSRQRLWIMPHGSLSRLQKASWGIHHQIFNFCVEKLLSCRDVTFIATSELEKNDIESSFTFGRVIVLPLGISEIPEIAAPKRLNLNEKIQIASISRISYIKRLDLVIQAVKLVRNRGLNIQLVIAGEGDLELLKDLTAMVRDYNLTEFVHFLPWADDTLKSNILGNAHLFVLASEHENFGYSLAEAISFGVPVITSRNVGIATLVESCGFGNIVEELNVDSLVEAIISTLANFQQVAKVVFERRHVISWSNLSNIWINALEE